MDEKSLAFIKKLKEELSTIADEEALEAVGFYTEYLSDASESGMDCEELLGKLDSPQEIAAAIKAGLSIGKTQRNPGLKNFTGILKYAFYGVTTPLKLLFISVFIVLAYSLVVTLFVSAFVFTLGAAGVICAAVYEAAAIPARFAWEIAGTAGMGLCLSGICLLVSYGLYRLGRLLIIASSGVIHRLGKKSDIRPSEKTQPSSAHRKGGRRIALIFTAMASLGLVVLFASGIPITYFTIFNSMKPQNVTVVTAEYSPAEISAISVLTAHSHIILKQGVSDKITVSYEQPDWLDYEWAVNAGKFTFLEKTNGRLPLFRLVKLHESRTELVISVPVGYSPSLAQLESTGGYIQITDMTGAVSAKTYTGSILLDNSDISRPVAIKAATQAGSITVHGASAGQKTNRGTEYDNSVESQNADILQSVRGNITIA